MRYGISLWQQNVMAMEHFPRRVSTEDCLAIYAANIKAGARVFMWHGACIISGQKRWI
jgi:hypothetical protein